MKVDSGISWVFLNAMCLNFPMILPSDGDRLVSALLDRYEIAVPNSVRERISNTPDAVSAQSSPLNMNHYQSPGNEASIASAASANNGAALRGRAVWIYWTGALCSMMEGKRKTLTSFQEESVEILEKQELAFKLIGHIMDKVAIDPKLLELVRVLVKEQLQSMWAFLKIKKRDWTEQGQLLKDKIHIKLSVYQASARLLIKTLASLDTEAKSSKRLWLGALALLIEAAKACLFSVWWKLRACEELFGSLLVGISQAAVTRGGQLLRLLLIHFKRLVLGTCAQADTSASSQGAMLESVLKTCCDIVNFGCTKDRSPVDTFIMGLATSIREKNDYEEEDEKEKRAAPAVQLNVIHLLAELNVAVNKPEVVDMILPLFIESLEEGDASTPGLLRLRLLDAVSRMASLGFEKSYREAIVLMIRSYLSKLSSVGSAESRTEVPEATTERVGQLRRGLSRGVQKWKEQVDFLGPLLHAVAEIYSDFDPSGDVEPSVLKKFRNLWFYIALFGVAPQIQKTQVMTKSVSTTLNSVGTW